MVVLVKEARTRLLSLRDERLPAMPAMLGEESLDVLSAAVGAVGATALSARQVQVTWRPGLSLTVSYDVQVAWEKHHRTTERFVVSTGGDLPEGAVILASGESRVAVWRMTGDPKLPGLAIAMDPERLRGLLESLGAPETQVSPRLLAYRPGRRAVVELTGKGLRLFIKVVPPSEVPSLQERHAIMASVLPVPSSHGWSSEYGLVVLQALTGDTLRTALQGKREAVPSASALSELLDRMPEVPDGRRVVSPIKAAEQHATLVGSILPELRERLDGLLDVMAACRAAFPSVPVHGDFHGAQVLTRDGAITGLLDVDTAGAGFRIDDWANFLGHLAVYELTAPRGARSRIARFARSVLSQADAETASAGELRRRVAAVIIGMATGPFRAQSETWPVDTRNRIALAERWAAEAADKKYLMRASQPSHVDA